MNRNFKSGGIKFRELDYSKSPPDKGQSSRNSLRSREDILKLFADPAKRDDSKKTIQTEVTPEISRKSSSEFDESGSWANEGILNPFADSKKDDSQKDKGAPDSGEKSFSAVDESGSWDKKNIDDLFTDSNNDDSQRGKENQTIEKLDVRVQVSSESSSRDILVEVKKSESEMKKPALMRIELSKRLPVKKLDIVKERAKVQSNVVDTTSNAENSTPSGKKIYNVMVGKISTRKHKQWDSDGILEVSGKSAVLKDVDGKVIGRTTVKPETIEEGFRMCLGGKEIEIVELASQSCLENKEQSTICSSTESLEPPLKKARVSKGFIPVKSGLHATYEPLIMPHPPLDIEWSEESNDNKIYEVSVDGCLASVLRPHQREGIAFMYKCMMGMNDPNFKGAILADEMGLGKTLQCISLIWTLLKKGPHGKPVLKRVLIIAPSSLCGNWNKEFNRWLGSMKISPYVVEGKQKVKDFTKTPRSCVMIISYEMFVRNVDDVNSLNFDLLICDEGHRLKNNEVKTLKFLNQLNCQRRILLTGTPVQNDLQEFYTLANFVNPGILGSFSEYKTYYERSIVKSQCGTAEEDQVIEGQQRARELHSRSKMFILRRTNNLINQYLPQKHELVIFCKPTVEQENLYRLISDYWFNRSVTDANLIPLAIITALKKVCNHPCLFTNENSNILDEILPSVLPTTLSNVNTSFFHSSKVKIVQAVFQNLKRTQEKLVLVSYFTQTLDYLEKLCCKEGLQFCRLDGNTPTNTRTKIVERFNSKDSVHCRIFLLSAKAGGVGLNLIGASRLILFDSDWNPANDAQAMARIWRDGQKRSVYIYRLLTTGTIEEKIYQRQISKIGLSEAVVDANHTASLKLSPSELKDLFSLDSNTSSVTHDLMDCTCTGSGDIPCKKIEESESNSTDSRDCQFRLQKKQSQQQITINQLLSWQHYRKPISSNLMQELMLQQVQECVTFIFKNSIEK